jgi:carboxymethylenebutenolidase
MMEQHLDIATADGPMNSFVVYPTRGGPFPVLLFYMDALGKREELHTMARRLARAGYLVVLSNLYHRRSRDFELRERSEPAMAQMYALMDSLDPHTTRVDTQAMLDFVDQHPAADANRIGALGYCMSGPFVIWAAQAFPQRLQVIAAIHGARLVTEQPDSPHQVLRELRCESYFACAQTDRWAPPEHIAQIEHALTASGAPHQLEWYAGVEHGFVFPQRGAIYNEAAAERHWQRLFELFGRTLRPMANPTTHHTLSTGEDHAH